MTSVLAAEGMPWSNVVALSVFFVCVAAVLICLIRCGLLVEFRDPAERTKPPEWRNETTVTRPNPSDPRPKGER